MSVTVALALLASGTPVITERWWFLFADDLVLREALRVTLDYYSLIQIGTSDEDAIGIARYDRTRQMPEIKDFIDRSTNWQLRGRLLRVYGIPADPGS